MAKVTGKVRPVLPSKRKSNHRKLRKNERFIVTVYKMTTPYEMTED
jgi:hypothetical protein